jgi:hypothetical protein
MARQRTREEWLRAAAKQMAPWIKAVAKAAKIEAAYPADTLVSVGWPRGGRSANDAIGQCWQPPTHVAGDNQRTIFISPELTEPVRVLDVMLHEMVHAALPMGVGHGGPFKRIVVGLGLEGKATATYAKEGSELHGRLVALARKLGSYHHVGLKKGPTGSGPSKGQSKWVRLRSESLEGYHATLSLKSLAEHGMPAGPDGRGLVVHSPGKFLLMCTQYGLQPRRDWFPGRVLP